MELEMVPVAPLDPALLRSVLSGGALADFEHTLSRGRELLGSRRFWNVNSAAVGGGVAEMLRSLIGYARGAGLDMRWVAIPGDEAFFRVTKRIHNRLHGQPGDDGELGEPERRVYERACEANAKLLVGTIERGDVVLLHDPQTAGMVPHLLAADVSLIWRSHVGVDPPNDLAREAWRFLTPYVELADAYVFSSSSYLWDGLDPAKTRVIPPSIDPFAPKNHPMSFAGVARVLRAAGLAAGHNEPSHADFQRLDGSVGWIRSRAELVQEQQLRLDEPLVIQISRWDRLKDPLGVMEAFVKYIHDGEAPHLLLAGPDVRAVADDPEGQEVFDAVSAAWSQLPRRLRRRVHLGLLPMRDADENAVIVNALQRRADVVVQKSLAEGFGLTVAEAMWKGRPVVASNVGGIRAQIEEGVTGFLVDPAALETFGERVSWLLEDPHGAELVGEAAQVRVREDFLPPRHFAQYIELLELVLGEAPARGAATRRGARSAV
jgi:trehalose synthase